MRFNCFISSQNPNSWMSHKTNYQIDIFTIGVFRDCLSLKTAQSINGGYFYPDFTNATNFGTKDITTGRGLRTGYQLGGNDANTYALTTFRGLDVDYIYDGTGTLTVTTFQGIYLKDRGRFQQGF